VTITGGKWTTYRRMAEDCVNQAAALAGLPARPCITRTLRIHGWHEEAHHFKDLSVYGSDAPAIQDVMRAEPGLGEPLDPELPYVGAEAIWAARCEMALTVEDVLARRTAALFLNAKAAVRMAPRVAELLARELGHSQQWQEQQVECVRMLARRYTVSA
jgi:glycerol-3-phosphate dehydrogenase